MRSVRHEMKTEYLIGKGIQAGGCRIIPIVRKCFISFVNKSREGAAMGGYVTPIALIIQKEGEEKKLFLLSEKYASLKSLKNLSPDIDRMIEYPSSFEQKTTF